MLFTITLQLKLRTWFQEEKQGHIASAATYYTFDQYIDHFNNTNVGKFKQRYLVNDTFYKQDGPLFLIIGGEGTLSDKFLSGKYSISYFAEQFGGYMFALEHRYYGKSLIFDDLTDMRYLSSKQALADIVEFIAFAKKQYGLKNSKVVVIGGSYSGNLANWARSQFPFVIDAAIATSGPSLGETDFKNYMKHASEALKKISDSCYKYTEIALTEAFKLLETDINKFREVFKADVPDAPTNLDKSIIESFLSTLLIGNIQYHKAPGYNGDEKFIGTVQQQCKDQFGAITEQSSNEEILLAYAKINDLSSYGPLTYAEQVKSLQNVKPADPASRSWYYQTCTEFGYYQPADHTIFGPHNTLKSQLQMCYDVFFSKYFEDDADLTKTTKMVNEQVDFTNAWFGARNQPRDHIIYTNGKVDPWSELSIVKELTWVDGQYIPKETETIWIEQGSHCTDMYMDWKINDQVRQQQLEKLKEWLK